MIETMGDFRLRMTMAGVVACLDRPGAVLGVLHSSRFKGALEAAIAAVAESELSGPLRVFFGAGVDGVDWRQNAWLWSEICDWGIRRQHSNRNEAQDNWRRQPHWLQIFTTIEPARGPERAAPEFLVNAVTTIRGHTGHMRRGVKDKSGTGVWVPWPEVGAWFFVPKADIPHDAWLSCRIAKQERLP